MADAARVAVCREVCTSSLHVHVAKAVFKLCARRLVAGYAYRPTLLRFGCPGGVHACSLIVYSLDSVNDVEPCSAAAELTEAVACATRGRMPSFHMVALSPGGSEIELLDPGRQEGGGHFGGWACV